MSRLDEQIADAVRIIEQAGAEHAGGHEIVGHAVLFSGGNDSSVLLDLMVRLGVATHAVHANTTIGVERTRVFVRERAAALGVPLLEELPPVSYREQVLKMGFPGPGQHYRMYQRLKERALRQARRQLVQNGRKQRVVFLAGRRRAESARRADVPEHERVDSVIWVSPLANWTSDDMQEYRDRYAVPRNPVAEALGMSGECLCGSFAEPGELERIRDYDEFVAAEIHAIEVELLHRNMEWRAGFKDRLREEYKKIRALRLEGFHAQARQELLRVGKERRRGPVDLIPEERCMWGWGAYRGAPSGPVRSGPLCSSCDFRADPVARLGLDEEQQDRVAGVWARIEARREARALVEQPPLWEGEA